MRPDLLLVRGSARFASKKSVILYAWRRQVTVLPTAPVCSQFCTYFQIYSPCHLAVSFLATSPAYEVSFCSSSNHNLVHPWASCPIIPNTVLVPLTMVITLPCQFDVRGRRGNTLSLSRSWDVSWIKVWITTEAFSVLRGRPPPDWWTYLTTPKGTLGLAGEI